MGIKEVREFIKYAIEEKTNIIVKYANGMTEKVEYRGYCYVIGNKDYSAKQLENKLVRSQNNSNKFIISLNLEY